MVFRGKPSKACLQCRKRKLRCDLQPIRCGQCIRASLTCSGYRDTTQLRIQDETQRTRHRDQLRQRKSIPNTLDEGIDNLARGAFFFHYVTDVSKVFDVLETLYMHRSGQKPLQASVDAASLAFFSFQQDSIKARHLARKQYLLALPQVNAALQSLANASSDSTLLAVLLLDLFEKFMGEPRSTTAWMSHVHGALALIKLRGRSQLHDYIGLRLSARLSMNLLISCVAASTRVPAALLDLRSDLENFLDKNDPKWQVTGLVIQYASHDADIRRSCHWTPGTINSMLRLDEEFRRLAGNMPTSWSFKTISIDEPSGRALEPYFHVYRDHAITQTWNVLRTTRILLNDTMRKHHLNFPHDKGNGSDSEQRYDVVETIDLLAREICASAYQFTQLRDESRSMHYSAFERARCYTLMFPLYVAAMYASVSTGIRPWVVKQLCFLSETVRIRQAKAVVDILGKGNDPDPWSIYALLGSYAFAA